MEGCDGEGGGLAEVKKRVSRRGVSSGSRGEHCLRRSGDERGCLCQSLIPPFGK